MTGAGQCGESHVSGESSGDFNSESGQTRPTNLDHAQAFSPFLIPLLNPVLPECVADNLANKSKTKAGPPARHDIRLLILTPFDRRRTPSSTSSNSCRGKVIHYVMAIVTKASEWRRAAFLGKGTCIPQTGEVHSRHADGNGVLSTAVSEQPPFFSQGSPRIKANLRWHPPQLRKMAPAAPSTATGAVQRLCPL